LEALQGSAKTGNAGIAQRTLATNKQAFAEIEDIFFIAFNQYAAGCLLLWRDSFQDQRAWIVLTDGCKASLDELD
jgi:hypothetical protein